MPLAHKTHSHPPAQIEGGHVGEPVWLEGDSQADGPSSFFVEGTLMSKANISKDALTHVHKIEKISVFHIK